MNDTTQQPQIDSQKVHVLKHLITRGSITQAQCLATYGCARLAARINDLRKAGVAIKTELVPNANRGKHARYSIEGKGTPEFTENVKVLLGV